MADKVIDPRDIAYILDRAALSAYLRSGKSSEAAVTISAELAHHRRAFAPGSTSAASPASEHAGTRLEKCAGAEGAEIQG